MLLLLILILKQNYSKCFGNNQLLNHHKNLMKQMLPHFTLRINLQLLDI